MRGWVSHAGSRKLRNYATEFDIETGVVRTLCLRTLSSRVPLCGIGVAFSIARYLFDLYFGCSETDGRILCSPHGPMLPLNMMSAGK